MALDSNGQITPNDTLAKQQYDHPYDWNNPDSWHNPSHDVDAQGNSLYNSDGTRRDGSLYGGNIVNPNAYQLGGHAGGAQEDTDRYRGLSGAAEGRQGPQINTAQYNADRTLESGARANQGYGLGSLQDIIQGRGTTVAEQQRRIGQQNASQLAASSGAGATGGGGNLAAASRLTGEQQGQIAADATGQAGLLHAHEVAAAQSQYSNAASAQRAQDLQRQGLSAQEAQSQAALEAQQRGLNDQRSAGLEGLGQAAEMAQMGAQQNQETQSDAVAQGDTDRNLAATLANQANRTANTDALVGAGAAAGAAYVKSASTPDPSNPNGASDIRAKENIQPGSTPVQRMLDKLRPYTFDYKDPAKHGEGNRTGVMAQHLEASPMGAEVVHADGEGVKRLDPNALAHATMAAVADVHHRLKAVEGKRPAATSQTLNKAADDAAAKDIMAYPARALPKGVEETSYKNWGLDHAQNGGR